MTLISAYARLQRYMLITPASIHSGGPTYFLPMQFLGPTLKSCDECNLSNDSTPPLRCRKRSGRKTQGSLKLSLLWFIDQGWTSTIVYRMSVSILNIRRPRTYTTGYVVTRNTRTSLRDNPD